MKTVEITRTLDKINKLVNTGEEPFKLFIKLYQKCKEYDKLLTLAKFEINIRIQPAMKNVSLQFEAIQNLLELYELADKKYQYYTSMWRLGVLCSKYSEPIKSYTNLKEAEEFFISIQDYDMIFLCKVNIGVLNYRINNYSEAENYYKKCEAILEDQKKMNKVKDEYSYNSNCYISSFNLSLVYLKLKKIDIAEFYCKKTIKIAKKLKNKSSIIKAKINLANNFIEQKKFLKSDALIEEFKDLKKVKESYIHFPILSTIFNSEKQKGNYKNAIKVLEQCCICADEYIKNTSKNFKNLLEEALDLVYEHGTKEEVIYFSRYLQALKFNLSKDSSYISKSALKQYEEIAELELEKKYSDEITYILGHDLKAPIRIVKNFSEILEDDPDKLDELLPLISQNTRYALELMNSTLDFAQIVSNIESFEQVSLVQVINTILAEIKPKIEQKNIEFFCDDLPVVQGNFSFLKQLFKHLLLNAIQFGKQHNTISINLLKSNKHFYLVEVKDKGSGIPKEELNSIFKLFKKSKHNQDDSNAGVGLAICKRIVDIHKGTIYATSELGKGSSFCIQLPVLNL